MNAFFVVTNKIISFGSETEIFLVRPQLNGFSKGLYSFFIVLRAISEFRKLDTIETFKEESLGRFGIFVAERFSFEVIKKFLSLLLRGEWNHLIFYGI
jgi:hypothetical protein